MMGMDLAGLPDLLASVGTLAKDIGKGGGGSTEAHGVYLVAAGRRRRRAGRSDQPAPAYTLVAWGKDDRSELVTRFGEESPDSTEQGARRKSGAVARSYG